MRLGKVRLRSIVAGAKLPLLLAVCCLAFSVSPARAEDDDLRSLELYNGPVTDIVSATRSPRPASQTAENITVVTVKEIEALNAHTLADIIIGVTGIQLEMNRTPGTGVNTEIQGANYNHLLILFDNVPINNLADNFPDIAMIPAQMIERVEIIKGAASSSWGSALGGVINVITKTPQADRPFNGMLSGSLGSQTTADSRGEASGTLGRLGYYLTAGNLRSDGLLPNNMVNRTNVYGKLNYELPARGALTLSTLYSDGSSGQFSFQSPRFNQEIKQNQQGPQLISMIALQYPLTDQFTLEGALRSRYSKQELTLRGGDDSVLQQVADEESSYGGILKLSWLSELQRVVAGVDFDHVKAHVSMPVQQADQLNANANRVGVYLNDTFTLGDFAVTPSVRYDHTGTEDDLFSPSLGITYALTENTVLRGYTSRGYSLVSLSRDDSTEKVWTSQIGIESGDIPYLWLKGTLFRNDTWNVSGTSPDPDFKQRQLKQGYELEARTLPYRNTSLSAGYTYIDATDGDTGAVLRQTPRHTVDVGVRYVDRGMRALLVGRYIDWNGHESNGRYGDVIWDLHLGKKFQYSEYGSVELFVSVRNLLNGNQYIRDVFKNAGRWAEGGVRCNF